MLFKYSIDLKRLKELVEHGKVAANTYLSESYEAVGVVWRYALVCFVSVALKEAWTDTFEMYLAPAGF